jgi:hypothetical protein
LKVDAEAEIGAVPSRDGGRVDSPREGGRCVAGAAVARDLVVGPTLFDNPPADTTRLLGAAIGRAPSALPAPGPTVLERPFLVAGVLVFRLALTLRAIPGVPGFAANCFGAAALSARVIRFDAGGLIPVSAILRFAPPARGAIGGGSAKLGGPMRWDVVSGSSTSRIAKMGAGPRMEGRLSGDLAGDLTGDFGGEAVCCWNMLGDFSVRGILLGDAILDVGCGRRESCKA